MTGGQDGQRQALVRLGTELAKLSIMNAPTSPPNWLHRFVRFLWGREPIVLLGLLVVLLGSWGFTALTEEVLEGDTQSLDLWAVRSMRHADDLARPIGPGWMAEVGRDLTALGGIAVLLLAIVGAAGFLAIHGAYRMLIVLLVSTLGGMLASLWMKHFFDRPRPDIVPHLSQVYTNSFPSGHSMMSAIVYLTLAVLVAPLLRSFWIRFYVIAAAVVLTMLVGISRVYMGVHYPTDVVAGWAAGLVWALLCWLVARSIPHSQAKQQPRT
ncbi:phosphatase PAP2 family protein [Allorhodopirellula heiligendammensis]|uniref:Phosphatidylglycerophosphatase B n=1 Tax=Allorhodopirellula heiligendammensis TaxID=2714739 RepID=A0A5C6C0G2_9BACT|nr:phosphatase PAP2 family protein [Allorhodopirellula heiligendammensis]TWU18043.1 phosphatidylglycerophosphatase B [Allorhodopirellula heiligendammensis]